MITGIIKKLFLPLGLAMLWLGFLCSYELNKQQKAVVEPLPKPASGHFETYTLSNDSYSEEAIEELNFNNPDSEENVLIYQLGDFPESEGEELEYMNTAGFVDDFSETDVVPESPTEPFPLILLLGGAGILLIGIYTVRKEPQKKQTF